MIPAEQSSHSFIVKIWLEEEATDNVPPFWRGHVTHVATGSRCYLQEAGDVLAFMKAYLQQWEAIPSGSPRPIEPGAAEE